MMQGRLRDAVPAGRVEPHTEENGRSCSRFSATQKVKSHDAQDLAVRSYAGFVICSARTSCHAVRQSAWNRSVLLSVSSTSHSVCCGVITSSQPSQSSSCRCRTSTSLVRPQGAAGRQPRL